jgi:cytochrome c oxidase cbb3-type subunit III
MTARSIAPLLAVLCGCSAAGRVPVEAEVARPDEVVSFTALYAQSCAGCHGAEGKGGAAVALADPVYLAIADDVVIRRVASNGIRGTAMPAFARTAGGMLTDAQVEAIVSGIRAWAKPDAVRGLSLPPYAAREPGDPKRGAAVYAAYCASCHGANGRGGVRASSIVDGSFLALVSDQSLRTTVIAGRPELGAPDWRGNAPGKPPMTAEEISDVVAWLAAQRPAVAGQPYPAAQTAVGERQ